MYNAKMNSYHMNGGMYGGVGNNMVQLQGMANNLFNNLNLNNRPDSFYFSGNALSLQSRIEALADAELHKIVDININVTGTQIQAFNTCSYCWTIATGSIIIIPIFFMCCGWWRKCTYPAYDVPASIYESLRKLLSGSSVRNLTLTVVDNLFGSQKASILYDIISQSRINGFTFINMAGDYNFAGNENSSFVANMRPIKQLTNLVSDIRWGSEIVL